MPDDLQLVSAVARSTAGMDLGEAWQSDPNGVPVHGTVTDALGDVDVLADYTSHGAVGGNVRAAVERPASGAHEPPSHPTLW